MITAIIIFISDISTTGANFMNIDIKKLSQCRNVEMGIYSRPLAQILDNIVDGYSLQDKENINNMVLYEIHKSMYGLPQVVPLVYYKLVKS